MLYIEATLQTFFLNKQCDYNGFHVFLLTSLML